MLIVLDFAKIDVVHHSFQILPTIVYWRGETLYKQFIGQKKEKNDVYFVFYVWKYHLLPYIESKNISRLEIFSDGGSKHFKCSSSMLFFLHLEASMNFSITYNFFASYHGANGCDGLAAHAAVG